ncbi:MAG: Maf family protein [Oscillospiraceae bacterium]|jgi:septum formation protein|nr:Maf family protein [Oscillospiraceae bacterium]
MKYILASASPRRKELLTLAGLSFCACTPKLEEETLPGEGAEEAALRLACLKAAAVAEQNPEDCVISADTIVVAPDGGLLGKPFSAEDAAQMLRRLSGREHRVVTGVCLRRGEIIRAFTQVTCVRFYPLTELEIESYIHSGEPMDKAGAYGIQGRGALLVEEVHGDYFNVVGLPVARVIRELSLLKAGDTPCPAPCVANSQ